MLRRLSILLALIAGCASTHPQMVSNLPLGDPTRSAREAPLQLDAITATATGELLTTEALAARLAGTRIVFIGESHTSAAVHAAQRRLIEALLAAHRKVLVGLEMFPYTVQPALDAWNAGEGTEADFVRASHWYKHWGFDWRYYRDIFLLRAQGVRFFGVNAPREVISAVRKKGFDKLTPEEAVHIPGVIDTTSAQHRQLFRSYFDAGDSTHAAGLSEAALNSMYEAQCAWDATMAFNAVRALKESAETDAIMVVLLGSGHVAFGLGAPRQAVHYTTEPLATVIPVPVVDEDGQPTRARASYADFLWALPPEPTLAPYPALGVNLSDGKDGHLVASAVTERGPAALAGLLAGDRIVSFDGKPVADKEAFLTLLAGKSWADGVALVIERAGKPLSMTVALRRTH
jgi:aminopeptidase N